MKIGIDLSRITEDKTGVEYYGYELARALFEKKMDNEFHAFSNKESFLQDFPTVISKRIIAAEKPNFKWIRNVVSILKKEKFDLFVSPSYFMFGVLFPRTVQIVHDLAPLRYPQYWPWKSHLMYRFQLRLATFRTKYFATNSEFTKKDVITTYPYIKNKTFMIGTGLHSWAYTNPSRNESQRVKQLYKLPHDYVLSVSTLQPRKNYIMMLRAFAILKKQNPDLQYLITGKKGWYYEDIFTEVKKLQLEDSVHFLGYVPEEDLPTIYDNAKVLLYCSMFEGFGLPALEAYARKIPVVTSDIPVLRETMHQYAFYADPQNPEDIAHQAQKALVSKTEINTDFLKQYEWKKVAQELLRIV